MILAIDAGNTHIVVGCIRGEEIVHLSRAVTDIRMTADELAVKLKMFLEFAGIDPASFEGAVISSVVPPINSALKQAVRMVTGLNALCVGTGLKTGLNIRIDNPAQLGADLVAGAVAALHKYSAPLIIFDMGTATTVSVIDKSGSYLGGAIMPGVVLSMNALSGGTSQLPKVSLEPPKRCIGTNTIDCMRSGAVFAAAAMMDGMVERIEEELGYPTTVIATGGIASSIVPYCRHKVICDSDLLLTGLAVLYKKNKHEK